MSYGATGTNTQAQAPGNSGMLAGLNSTGSGPSSQQSGAATNSPIEAYIASQAGGPLSQTGAPAGGTSTPRPGQGQTGQAASGFSGQSNFSPSTNPSAGGLNLSQLQGAMGGANGKSQGFGAPRMGGAGMAGLGA